MRIEGILAFSETMMFLEAGQWTRSIEPSKKDNNIEYLKVRAKASWEAYRQVNGLQEDMTWEKLKKM